MSQTLLFDQQSYLADPSFFAKAADMKLNQVRYFDVDVHGNVYEGAWHRCNWEKRGNLSVCTTSETSSSAYRYILWSIYNPLRVLSHHHRD